MADMNEIGVTVVQPGAGDYGLFTIEGVVGV